MIIHDRFGRPVKNLRISVTSNCNLNCFYCHREGVYSFYHCYKELQRARELSPNEIARIVKIAVSFGVNSVKLTGGEPLIRRDILEIVKNISEIKEIRDLSLVTNGLLLESYAYNLKTSGLNRINVSLPTLNPEKYTWITGYKKKDGVEKIIRGIKKALEADLNPVKVNMVVLRGVNDDEIPKLIDFARETGAVLQLIELQDPNGFNSSFFKKYFYPLKQLEEKLEKEAKKVIIRDFQYRKRLFLDDVEIEIVRPMFNSNFCKYCKRLRVTSIGEFKPCLMRDDNHVDFSSYLNKPNEEENLRKLFIEAVRRREPFFK